MVVSETPRAETLKRPPGAVGPSAARARASPVA
jgi:hypothetical protein